VRGGVRRPAACESYEYRTGTLRLCMSAPTSIGTSVSSRWTRPISPRRKDDPDSGNRITLDRFTVPVAEADQLERARVTGWRCRGTTRDHIGVFLVYDPHKHRHR